MERKIKICNLCRIEKPIDNFILYYDNRADKYYRHCRCHLCRNKKGKETYERNWNKVNESHKIYREKCKKEELEQKKIDRLNFIGPIIPDDYRICKKCNKLQPLTSFPLHSSRTCRIGHCKSCERLRMKKRKQELKHKIHAAVYMSIKRQLKNKNIKKTDTSFKYVGCNEDKFKSHIESQFEPWMNWQNYGPGYALDNKGCPIYLDGYTISLLQWNYDHIRPLEDFNWDEPETPYKAFNYINWRPLLANDNYAKSDILPDGSRARNKKLSIHNLF